MKTVVIIVLGSLVVVMSLLFLHERRRPVDRNDLVERLERQLATEQVFAAGLQRQAVEQQREIEALANEQQEIQTLANENALLKRAAAACTQAPR